MKLCWNVTNLCNENCIYCFRDLIERAISLKNNLLILPKLKALGTEAITFAGGEPLLYPEIDVLMNKCHDLGITVNLITNGSVLNETNLDKYLSCVTKLTFSVDSPNNYINEKSGRGINHYEHIKAILPSIKERYPDIILEVNTVVTSESAEEIDFMFEALGSEISFYGLKKWKISRFCPLRGYAKMRESFLSVSDETFDKVKRKYVGKKSVFEIQVRDLDAIEENIILSPHGGLKKAVNSEEINIVGDLAATPTDKIISLYKDFNGGSYV